MDSHSHPLGLVVIKKYTVHCATLAARPPRVAGASRGTGGRNKVQRWTPSVHCKISALVEDESLGRAPYVLGRIGLGKTDLGLAGYRGGVVCRRQPPSPFGWEGIKQLCFGLQAIEDTWARFALRTKTAPP